MKYYQDITLIPDVEANLGFLWHKVYQQVHLALVENKIAKNQSAVAVSFPGYGDKSFPLGDKLRLLAESKTFLEQLEITRWLSRYADYCHLKTIKPIPEGVDQFVCFKRKRFKSNLEKLATRRAKYKNESMEIAKAHFAQYEEKSSLPYINMTSLSMDKKQGHNPNFKLFIEQKFFKEPQQNIINCYGLSGNQKDKVATVPWFSH